jgi:hypothetical protein
MNNHNDSCYDVAQICVNGHVINRTVFFFAKGVIEVKIVFLNRRLPANLDTDLLGRGDAWE